MTRVLVADDDADTRGAVARLLAAEGMSVEEAASGGEALTKLASGVDLLVTDVIMPELGGLQAAAMARTAGEQIPILVMTGRRDAWIAQSVKKLQRADLLYKPFSATELVEHVRALLRRRGARPVPPAEKSEPHVFPPSLVPLLRQSVGDTLFANVPDEELAELISIVFFAGLETEEGERNPLRVVFVESPLDAEPPVAGVPPPLYRWSTLRFETARELSVNVLVKLAAVLTDGREYVQVSRRDGRLVVSGLAREGVNLEHDTALKIVVDRPGGLSFRVGRYHVLDYEHGRVQAVATSRVILSGGPVRRALERAAARLEIPPEATTRYLDAVRMLVAQLSAHGRGGILIWSAEPPETVGDTGYQTHPDISVAAMLLRLHRLQSHSDAAGREHDQLLAGALEAEIQHTIEELGALTALDGATVLDSSLALLGFGIVLPVGDTPASILEAEDVEGEQTHPFDLGSKGTRHRAAAMYAWTHPESVVFVASQDGDLRCMVRSPDASSVMLWRFRASELRR